MRVALKKSGFNECGSVHHGFHPHRLKKMELHTKLVVPSESTPEKDSFESYHHSISFKATNVRTTPLKCLKSGSERFNKFRIKTGIKRLQGRRGRALVGVFNTCQLTKLSELYLNCS